jgi:geranylgeranyl reductase family protein
MDMSKSSEFDYLVHMNYDVVIVGAGPAGSACALALQKSGLRVALIDQASFPRDKICGDAIPGKTFKALDYLNPEWSKELFHQDKSQSIQYVHFYTDNKNSLTIQWVLPAINCTRTEWDNYLVDLVKKQTLTDFHPSTRVQRIERISNGFQVLLSTTDKVLTSKMVIGCDGAYSIVKRFLPYHKNEKKQPAIAVRAYYKNVACTSQEGNDVFFSKSIYPGYVWIFPLGNNIYNVGCGYIQHSKNTEAKPLRTLLQDLITTHPIIAPKFKNAHPITEIKGCALPLGLDSIPLSDEGVLLCGDAASLIDPFIGHGIDKAMWSGILAGEQIIKSFESNRFDASFLKAYDHDVYKKLGPELRASTRQMNLLIRFPWLLTIVSIFSSKPRLAQWLVRKVM